MSGLLEQTKSARGWYVSPFGAVRLHFQGPLEWLTPRSTGGQDQRPGSTELLRDTPTPRPGKHSAPLVFAFHFKRHSQRPCLCLVFWPRLLTCALVHCNVTYEWNSRYGHPVGVRHGETSLLLTEDKRREILLHSSLAGTHACVTGYAKHARPGLLSAWAISQGCGCTKQPWGMKQYLPLEQRARLLATSFKTVGSPSLMFLSCNVYHCRCGCLFCPCICLRLLEFREPRVCEFSGYRSFSESESLYFWAKNLVSSVSTHETVAN